MKKALILLVLAAFSVSASACSFNVSTASLSDVTICHKLKDGLCEREDAVFKPDDPVIYVSAKLNNAPEGTKLTFLWRYLEGGGQDIDSVDVKTESGQNIARSSLAKPPTGWPEGNYEVVLKLGTQNSKAIRKSFKVVK